MLRAARIALGLALVACSSPGDASHGPFPDSGGAVLVPDRFDEDWTVRVAFSDTAPDPSAFTYLTGGEPITVHRVGDGLVFEARSDRDHLPDVAEGDTFVTRPSGGGYRHLWARGVGADAVRAVADRDGGEVVGRLPEGWKHPLAGPSFAIDLGDGRDETHVSIRRSRPAELAAFRALLKGSEVAASYSTEASIQDPITTDPTREIVVRGRDAMVGPLSSGVRALVVDGDPGLTVLTSGNRLANFVSDDGLVAIAESLRSGTPEELDAWLDGVLEAEVEAYIDDMRALGEPELEIDSGGRTLLVVRTTDDARCIVVRVHRSRSGVDHWCARPSDVPFATLMRPDAVGAGVPSFALVAGIADQDVDILLDMPDGSTIRAEEHALRTDDLVFFFADVSGYAAADIVVDIGTERIVIDPADFS